MGMCASNQRILWRVIATRTEKRKHGRRIVARLFFETHDFTQLNRQGPDVGKQYRSAVFYLDEEQKQTAAELIKTLKEKGFAVKTEVTKAAKFWPAELYHQDYYNKTGKTPYCHVYRKIF